MSLIDIIYNCKQNVPKAQRQLYELYKVKLFHICLKYCKNTVDAEDVLQEVFIIIFNKLDTFDVKRSFDAWVSRITINKAIDKYHQTKVKHLPIIEEITEDVSFEEETIHHSLDYILKTVQDLPNRYRIVFNLYELDGYSHKEIAEKLQISIGTSKSNLHRARLILKQKLGSEKKSTSNYG